MVAIKVYPAQGKNGAVVNQYEIVDYRDKKAYFQSYESLIAEWDGKHLTVGNDWDYSTTTTKYFKQWCERYEIKLPKGKNFSDSIRKGLADGSIKRGEF